jgi:hypothetical protein
MPDAMANESVPVQFVLEQIRELKHDIRDMKRDLRDDIGRVDEKISGNDGVTERITALEVKMEEIADRETTPISIATTRKAGYKEHGMTAGIGVSAAAIVQVVMEIVKGLGK